MWRSIPKSRCQGQEVTRMNGSRIKGKCIESLEGPTSYLAYSTTAGVIALSSWIRTLEGMQFYLEFILKHRLKPALTSLVDSKVISIAEKAAVVRRNREGLTSLQGLPN